MRRQEKLNKWTVLWSAIGISIVLGLLYVWSVISKGLQDELHWTSTQASMPYTVFTISMAIGFFISGRLQDNHGPRKFVTLAAVLMGIGLLFSGFLTTPLLVVIGFGIINGFGVGAGNVASLSPSLKWFPYSKRGMVSGAVLAGIGFSAVIYSPLSNYLLGAIGVSNTFLAFGAIAFALIFVLSFNMYDPPQGYDRELGMFVLKADAGTEGLNTGRNTGTVPAATSSRVVEESSPYHVADKPTKTVSGKDVPPGDMLKTPSFYLMFFLFAISSASGLMIIGHAAKIVQIQASWEGGFLLVIVLSIFNTLGRFLGGSISDKIGRTMTLIVILAIQAVNMLLFGVYSSIPTVAIGILAAGFCYGSIFSVMPALTSDLYGLKNFGANYGTVFLAWGIGGIIGPMTAASIFDKTGAYDTSFLIACALSVAALIIVFGIRKEIRKGWDFKPGK